MNKHLQWLITNKDYIKIRTIEKALSMPEGTLKKYVDGNRKLNKQWDKPVTLWVERFLKVNPEPQKMPPSQTGSR